MQYIQSHLLVLLATFIISGSFLVSKSLAETISPFSLTLLRFIIAALVLLPIVLYKRHYRIRVLATMPRSLFISFFYAGFFVCMLEALKTTNSLNTATLYTLVPFLTALISIRIFSERLASKKVAVYVIGVIGTLWVIFDANLAKFFAFYLNQGDIIFIGGCFAMAWYSISMKLFYRGDQLVVLVFCTLVGGALWMTLAIFLMGQSVNWQQLTWPDLLNVAYLAIFATLGTSYLMQKTTVIIGPSKVMAYIFLNPACVALLMAIFSDESLNTMIIPGIVLSGLATVMLQRQSSTPEK